MGTSLARFKYLRRTTEEAARSRNNNNSKSTNDTYFVGEVLPERYLVLLTEQMTEMLFRLMTFNETSMMMLENGSDYQTRLDFSIDSNDQTQLARMNLTNDRSSSQSQSRHQSCSKCKMKTLTIEEFRELHNAFSRVDNDHDHFLTRDEIRTTLNYLFELTESDIQEIISVFDTNKDERISLEEYIGMSRCPSYVTNMISIFFRRDETSIVA